MKTALWSKLLGPRKMFVPLSPLHCIASYGAGSWRTRARLIFPVQPHGFDLSCFLYSVVWGPPQLYHLGLFYMLENVPACVYRTKAQLASSLSQGKFFSENGFSAGWGRQVYTFLRYSVQPPSPPQNVCLLHISWLASESVPIPFSVHVPLHLRSLALSPLPEPFDQVTVWGLHLPWSLAHWDNW